MRLLENQCVDLNLLGPEDVNLKKQRENALRTKQRHIINVSTELTARLLQLNV